MAETIRLQVDILKQQLRELEELQRLGGLRSKRELWDTAFTLLRWATRRIAQGHSVGSMSDDGVYTELVMPFLEHYAAGVRAAGADSEKQSEVTTDDAVTTAELNGSARRNGGGISLAKRKQTA